MNSKNIIWKDLYNANLSKLIGVCRRYVQNKEIAEDLAQDAFLTAINKYKTYSGKGTLDAWLRKIAVNTALMYLRNRKTELTNYDIIQVDEQPLDDPANKSSRYIIEHAEFSENELLEIIDQLPEHHKLVFNLYVIDNFTHKQIGKQLNISSGTSKSHLSRARKKIQELLFQKALNKTNAQQEKKRKALFLFIIPFKMHYIDRLFKTRFSQFSIPPTNKSNKTLNSNKPTNLPIKTKKLHIPTNLKYWFAGISSGFIIAFSSFKIFNSNSNEQKILNNSSTTNTLKKLHKDIDTLNNNSETITYPGNRDSLTELKNNQPVVIKKTLVKRKTVIIRDTILLIDSSNAD